MPAAPWKPLLQHHLTLIKPPVFSLATISSVSSPTNPTFSPPPTPLPSHTPLPASALTPRLRSMIYRGFLGSLPPNSHNPLAEHNPTDVFESECLTFTTDSRATKAGEFQTHHRGGGDAEVGTSGGGEVELCVWVAGDTTTGEDVQNQWRVRGRCYLLAERDVADSTAITNVLEGRMVPTGKPGRDQWEWKREVQRHWGNLAPAMRGSFANPPPGTPLSVPLDSLPVGKSGGPGLEKGKPVSNEEVLSTEGHAARARANFRVGVVVPEVVERVDLNADEKRARRWVWWRVDGQGEGIEAGWKGVETWP